MFCKKLDNFKNKPARVLKIFYDQMLTLPSSDDITRFDGMLEILSDVFWGLKMKRGREKEKM